MIQREGLPYLREEAYSTLVQFYEYDRNIPLNARVLQRDENETCIREKLVFRGLNNDRIPGLITIPTVGAPPYPCILLAHGMGGSKESLSEVGTGKVSITQELLKAGLAVMVSDAPYHGERTYSIDYESIFSYIRPNNYRELIVQWTIEYRLALDYLAGRPEIDAARIGTLGYSLGGAMVFNFVGVDPRIKAAVTCVALPLSRYYLERIGWDETALDRMQPIAPQTFAPAIKRTPFLMINGNNDTYGTLEDIQELFERIGSPVKKHVIFDCGHALPPDHLPIVVDWFRQYLI